MFSASDHAFMARALRLAQRGLNTTTPNPRVGCVLVRGGEIVAEGFHERPGEAHAEVAALRAAGSNARGATAYVTLEPCSHHGRTPPCADALIGAGVQRVIAAVQDPNPRVSGEGMKRLRAAAVQVDSGLLEGEARELNVGFFARMQRGSPWVRVKTAATLDGRTALIDGRSQWITSEAARRDGHRWRARSCAVMVGIGTLLADDPQLTVRGVDTHRQPLRIVVDRHLQIPLEARVLTGGDALIVTADGAPEKARRLEQLGASVVRLPRADGKVDLAAMMRELARRELNEILVESGSRLNGALLQAGLVDELLLYFAPRLLGDSARGMFDLGRLESLDQSVDLAVRDLRRVGADLRILARIERQR